MALAQAVVEELHLSTQDLIISSVQQMALPSPEGHSGLWPLIAVGSETPTPVASFSSAPVTLPRFPVICLLPPCPRRGGVFYTDYPWQLIVSVMKGAERQGMQKFCLPALHNHTSSVQQGLCPREKLIAPRDGQKEWL